MLFCFLKALDPSYGRKRLFPMTFPLLMFICVPTMLLCQALKLTKIFSIPSPKWSKAGDNQVIRELHFYSVERYV